MPRYKLTIAYDGTGFCGWQKQEPPSAPNIAPERVLDDPLALVPDSSPQLLTPSPPHPTPARLILRTVQEVVERACREVVREPIQLAGASRTDSGVHARGQVGAFTCSDAGWPLDRGTDKLVRAINSRLPDDVLVVAAEAAADAFNPIADCAAKGYSYTLHVSPHRPLWNRRYVHHVWVPLDLAAMNAAAARLIGEHDFAAFAASGHGRLSTVRTIFECRVEGVETGQAFLLHAPNSEPGTHLTIHISGNGFLWNMVRIIAGTLVEVGRGKLTPDDVSAAIQSKDRRNAGPTLPPEGLCLEWIRYDGL